MLRGKCMRTISKGNKNFQKLKFVLKARSKDEIKPIFTKLYIEENEEGFKTLICTDSCRLHLLIDKDKFFKDLKNGFYDIIKNDSKEIVINESETDGKFPEYRQIMPDKKAMLRTSQITTSKNRLKETAIIYRDFYKSFPESSICINSNFLTDALIDNYECSVFFVESIAKNKSVYAAPFIIDYNDKMTALIMPLLKF